MTYIGGIDQYARLMLHMLGNFNDSTYANGPKTVTPQNSPTIDTSILNAWGTYGGAGKFVGASSQYLSLATSPDWYFTGDFTIRTRVQFHSLPTSPVQVPFVAQYQDGNNRWKFYIISSGSQYEVYFQTHIAGTLTNAIVSSATTVTTGVWYDFEVDRHGNNWYIFLGGTSIGSASNSLAFTELTGNLQIGYDQANAYYLDGWLNETLVKNGVAMHTSNFTPPTQPYDTSGNMLESGAGTDIDSEFTRALLESGAGVDF